MFNVKIKFNFNFYTKLIAKLNSFFEEYYVYRDC